MCSDYSFFILFIYLVRLDTGVVELSNKGGRLCNFL